MKKIVLLGLLLGAAFGTWNLIATGLDPLSHDSPLALLFFYGPMFVIWSLAGFIASRRTRRPFDAILVAAALALVTFSVFDLAVILRVDLFLDTLARRSDWRDLTDKFPSSGFKNFRAYANYRYILGAPFKIFAVTLIGAATGIPPALLIAVTNAIRRPESCPPLNAKEAKLEPSERISRA